MARSSACVEVRAIGSNGRQAAVVIVAVLEGVRDRQA